MTNTENIEEQLIDAYFYSGITKDNIKEILGGALESVLDQISKCYEQLCNFRYCEWLKNNKGTCCNHNDDIEKFKGCPPCNDEKARDMTDTAVDIAKENLFKTN